MPSVIDGFLSSIAALAYLHLPETLGRPLPDTIEQVDNMAATEGCKRCVIEFLHQ
jgi:hypothetical protein